MQVNLKHTLQNNALSILYVAYNQERQMQRSSRNASYFLFCRQLVGDAYHTERLWRWFTLTATLGFVRHVSERWLHRGLASDVFHMGQSRPDQDTAFSLHIKRLSCARFGFVRSALRRSQFVYKLIIPRNTKHDSAGS